MGRTRRGFDWAGDAETSAEPQLLISKAIELLTSFSDIEIEEGGTGGRTRHVDYAAFLVEWTRNKGTDMQRGGCSM